MGKAKILLISSYTVLVLWWLVLLLAKDSSGYANSLFSFGMGSYALLVGVYLLHQVKNSNIKGLSFASAAFLGMICFGVGNIFWFYYDTYFGVNIPFPSAADFFYVLQFPFAVYGLLSLSNIKMSEEGSVVSDIKKVLIETVLFVFFIFLLSLVVTYITIGLTLENYLLLHFPVESFALTILAVLVHLKYVRVWKTLFTRLFIMVVLGYMSWFFADCLFFYEVAASDFYSGSFVDFLFTSGVFLVYLGYTEMLGKLKALEPVEDIRGLYFERVKYLRPTSLNID
jgi:hypothetical protein